MSKTLFFLIFTANRRPVWLIRSTWGWKMNRVVLSGSSAQRRGRLYSHDLPTLLVGVMQLFPRHQAMARIPSSAYFAEQISYFCMLLHDMKHIFQGMLSWSLCRASRNKVLFAHFIEQVITVIIDCQSDEQELILRAMDLVEKLEGGKSGCLSLLWVHITFTRFSFEL